jgi:hypothetical protein
MRRFLFPGLFVLAGAVAVLAQTPNHSIIQQPFNAHYARLHPQPLHAPASTVDLDADPTLAPGSTPNHGQSIVGNPGGIPGVLSVPNFSRSFTAYNQTFPYTMIGNEPALGHTTSVPMNLVPVSLQLLNPDGSIFLSVPVQQYMNLTVNSPNFVDADYDTGHGQLADAIQRAEFYNSMKQDWHTELHPVNVLDEVTVQVPATLDVTISGSVFTVPTYQLDSAPDGETVVLMLDLFFDEVVFPTVVNNEINAGNFTTDAVNMLFLPNTYLFAIDRNGVPSDCCTLGFHTYISSPGDEAESRWVTVFASWVAPAYFSAGFSDVTAMSHEISETLNDPFINNVVPRWQNPDVPSLCQSNLETGDPLVYSDTPSFAMPMRVQNVNFIYHPQNEALLQWFEQLVPSDAYEGTYSYPYETALTAPATLCP